MTSCSLKISVVFQKLDGVEDLIFSDEKGEGERWLSCSEAKKPLFFHLNWYIFSHACQLGMKKAKAFV